MPIYEFHCTDCETSFETLVRPGHDEDAACPSCHSDHLSRELSIFASGRAGGESMPSGAPLMRSGGCCGGGCGCN